MSQLWPAHPLDIDDLGIKGRYLRKLIRAWSLHGTRGNARGVGTVTGKGKWEVPKVRRVMDRLNRAGRGVSDPDRSGVNPSGPGPPTLPRLIKKTLTRNQICLEGRAK